MRAAKVEYKIAEEVTNGANGLTKYRDQSFDYQASDTSWGSHGIHPYPAMMIYPIARRMLLALSQPNDVVLDPFMGSGTVLVEGLLQGRNAYGVDINPLALLLTKVKTTPLNRNELLNTLQDIITPTKISPAKPTFFNIDFWFKEDIVEQLAVLLAKIKGIDDAAIKNFFKVVFSETVRAVSNTRNGEFKLLRVKDLEKHNPNVFKFFERISQRNIDKMQETYTHKPKTWIKILECDTRDSIPIDPGSIGLILTSPPYGDSKTTVAYGQFSRLSLQWLGYEKVNIDRESLGGVPCKSLVNDLPSNSLQQVINIISDKDEKRARDVLSFYIDLSKCIGNLSPLVKRRGYFCAVVGNRRVKQTTIPTHMIITELGQAFGFTHIKTIVRAIPNKRMPRANSPTNVGGVTETTMNEECIVVLRKESVR